MSDTQSPEREKLAACPYVVGSIIKADLAFVQDEDGNPLWEAEVQTRGGDGQIATVYGESEADARAKAEAIAEALANFERTPPTPAGDELAREPVAWACRHPDGGRELEWHSHVPPITDADRADGWTAEPLYARLTTPATTGNAEPAAWLYERTNTTDGNKPYSKRRWVTDVMLVKPQETPWQRNIRPLYDHPATTGNEQMLREAASELEQAEARYRYAHDILGAGDSKTGRAWDLMKRAGDKVRAALSSAGTDTGQSEAERVREAAGRPRDPVSGALRERSGGHYGEQVVASREGNL